EHAVDVEPARAEVVEDGPEIPSRSGELDAAGGRVEHGRLVPLATHDGSERGERFTSSNRLAHDAGASLRGGDPPLFVAASRIVRGGGRRGASSGGECDPRPWYAADRGELLHEHHAARFVGRGSPDP